MDKMALASLRSWLMTNYSGTPTHEVKGVLDDIADVIDEHGLLPAAANEEDWEGDESDENDAM